MKALSRDRQPAKSEILPRGERTVRTFDAGFDIPVQSPEKETMNLVGNEAGKGQTVKHAATGMEIAGIAAALAAGTGYTAYGVKTKKWPYAITGAALLATGIGALGVVTGIGGGAAVLLLGAGLLTGWYRAMNRWGV